MESYQTMRGSVRFALGAPRPQFTLFDTTLMESHQAVCGSANLMQPSQTGMKAT